MENTIHVALFVVAVIVLPLVSGCVTGQGVRPQAPRTPDQSDSLLNSMLNDRRNWIERDYLR
jgi:hypothetical protein